MAIVLRPLTVFVLAAMGCGAFARDLSTPITLTQPGANARSVLADVGKQAGVQLDVDAALAGEPLILDVKAVPLSELMKKIAETLGGEWRNPKPEVYELKYTDVQKQADWAAHIELRTAALRASIGEAAKTAETGSTWNAKAFRSVLEKRKILIERKDSSYQSFNARAAQERKLPIGRALARLAQLLDPGDLAALDLDERMVFSTAPTRMQKPLGPHAMAVIRALNAEHAAIIDAMQGVTEGKEQTLDGITSDVPQYYRENLKRPISRITLIGKRKGTFEGVDLSLCATDSTGYRSLCGTLPLRDQAIRPPDPTLAADKTPIVLSDRAKAYQQPLFQANTSGGAAPRKLSQTVGDLYVRPEIEEPLKFVDGECLLSAARSENRQLVATLPDEAFQNIFSIESGKTTIGDYLQRVDWTSSVTKRDGWLAVVPRDRWEAIQHRTPRKALAVYLSAVRANPFVSLDVESAFAVAYPYPEYTGLSTWFQRAFAKQHVIWSQAFEETPRRALGLWGLLTSVQRQSLIAGADLPMIQLSPEQREAVEYLTFRSAGAQVTTYPVGAPPPVIYPNIAWEPTESLPDGLPPGTALTLSTSSRTVPFRFPDARNGFIQAMGTETLARNRLAEQDGNQPSATGANQFRMGTETTGTFRLMFARDLHSDYSLMSAAVDMTKPVVGYEGLPEDLRTSVEALIKRQLDWRAQNKNRLSPPGKNPPPP